MIHGVSLLIELAGKALAEADATKTPSEGHRRDSEDRDLHSMQHRGATEPVMKTPTSSALSPKRKSRGAVTAITLHN